MGNSTPEEIAAHEKEADEWDEALKRNQALAALGTPELNLIMARAEVAKIDFQNASVLMQDAAAAKGRGKLTAFFSSPEIFPGYNILPLEEKEAFAAEFFDPNSSHPLSAAANMKIAKTAIALPLAIAARASGSERGIPEVTPGTLPPEALVAGDEEQARTLVEDAENAAAARAQVRQQEKDVKAAAAHAASVAAAATKAIPTTWGKGEGLTSESTRKKAARAQQCFLLYNNHFFAAKHREMLGGTYIVNSSNSVEFDSAYTSPQEGRFSSCTTQIMTNTSAGYYSGDIRTGHTTTIMVYDGDDTNDSTILNRIKSKKSQDVFDDITPAEYAQLIPSLRLYKLLYDRHNKLGGSQGMIEFEFGNKIDAGDIQAIDKTFDRNIRGDGVGVESFEWSYLGTDPFTATRDLKATLKLKFQSFYELNKDRIATIKDGNTEHKFKYKYLDLIIQANCTDEVDENNGLYVYDPGCYEVVAEVGYAKPANKIFSNLDDKRKEELLAAVDSTRERIYLVMTNHSFEFGQDGTFDLTIDYRARLGSQMGSRKLNVLLPGGGNADDTANQAKLKELKEKQVRQKNIEKEEKAKGDSGTPDAGTDPEEKSESQQTQEEIDALMKNTREDFYNALYSSLKKRNWIHGVAIETGDLEKFLKYDKVDLRKETVSNLPVALPLGTSLIHAETPYSSIYSMSGRDDARTRGTITSAKAVKFAKDNQLAGLKKFLEGDTHLFHFVYFGDIIATVRDWVMGEDAYAEWTVGWKKNPKAGTTTAAGHAPDALPVKETVYHLKLTGKQLNRMRSNFKIILGNVQLKDWESGETRLVNLAHIPVSLPAFLNFMTRKVVAQKRSVYSFSSFINDLLREVVMVNLNTACFGGLSAGKVRTTAQMITLEAADGAHDTGPVDPITQDAHRTQGHQQLTPEYQHYGFFRGPHTGGKSAFGPYNQFHCQDIAETNKLNTTAPSSTGASQAVPAFDYLLINTLTTHPKLYGVFDIAVFNDRNPVNTKDETGDKVRGIPHYTFGMDRGLLKTVKFAKTDQEYLPEAKYEQEGSSAINQLAAVYDVTFEMLGTARFQPGQYIYFNPVTIGVGEPWQTGTLIGYLNEHIDDDRSMANLMGLGGYHLVVEVACSIKRGEYNTTLKTRWTTSGCHPVTGDCGKRGG